MKYIRKWIKLSRSSDSLIYNPMNPKKLLPYQNERTYTPEQLNFLAPYLSDVNEDIFILKNLEGVVGAAFARYSRQKGGIKDTLLELVVNEKIDPLAKSALNIVLLLETQIRVFPDVSTIGNELSNNALLTSCPLESIM